MRYKENSKGYLGSRVNPGKDKLRKKDKFGSLSKAEVQTQQR